MILTYKHPNLAHAEAQDGLAVSVLVGLTSSRADACPRRFSREAKNSWFSCATVLFCTTTHAFQITWFSPFSQRGFEEEWRSEVEASVSRGRGVKYSYSYTGATHLEDTYGEPERESWK